jgi:hypothetical protein
LAIVEQSAVERLATLLEREVALEAVARELPAGKRRDELLAELVELRNLIKALKARVTSRHALWSRAICPCKGELTQKPYCPGGGRRYARNCDAKA